MDEINVGADMREDGPRGLTFGPVRPAARDTWMPNLLLYREADAVNVLLRGLARPDAWRNGHLASDMLLGVRLRAERRDDAINELMDVVDVGSS